MTIETTLSDAGHKMEQAVARAVAQPTGTPPLAELARGRKNACILVCDITRPVPNETILRPMLRVLRDAGIAREGVLCSGCCATPGSPVRAS